MLRILDISNEKILRFDKEKWKEGRSFYIGGSESFALGAEILDVCCRWSTPLTLWCEKIGVHVEKSQGHMQYGKKRELEILQEAEFWIKERLNLKTEIFGNPYTYRMAEYPFIGANLDGFLKTEYGELAGLEIKIAFSDTEWQENKIPLRYWNQVQHYMLVTGLENFFIVVEIQGDTKVRCVQSDLEYQKKLLESMINFWECVKNRIQPEPMGVGIEKAYLKQLKMMNAPHIEDVQLRMLAKNYQERKSLQKQKTELKKQIQNYGDAVFFGDHFCMLENRTVQSIDIGRLKEKYPQIYTECLKKKQVEYLYVSEKVYNEYSAINYSNM